MLIRMCFLRFTARCVYPELVSRLPVGLCCWENFTVRLIVDYFLDVRGAVKGTRHDLVGEGVQMCVGAVVGLVGRGAAMWWRVATRTTFRGWFKSNLAETRAFYNADFFSGSRSSAEPVMLTRATHSREQIMANVRLASRGFFSVYTQSGQVKLRNQSSVSSSNILADWQRGHRIRNGYRAGTDHFDKSSGDILS